MPGYTAFRFFRRAVRSIAGAGNGDDLRAAIYAALLADPDVAAIVGARVFPSDSTSTRRARLPQGAGTDPAVTFMVISNVRGKDLDGSTGTARARVQIDCWSEDVAVCVALSRIVRLKWDGFRGTLGSVTVTGAFPDNEFDLTEDMPRGSDTVPVHHIATDWFFHYRETAPIF